MRGADISVPSDCATQRGATLHNGVLSASLIPRGGSHAVTLCVDAEDGDEVTAAANPGGERIPFEVGRAVVPVDATTESITAYRHRGGVTDCETLAICCELEPAEDAEGPGCVSEETCETAAGQPEPRRATARRANAGGE